MAGRVSPYVRSRLAELLSPEDAEWAVTSLESTAFPLAAAGSLGEQRIHLAILKLTCDPWDSIYAEPSRLERFRGGLELARTDWRDLFVAAGLQHDDWPRVLAECGYEAPELAGCDGPQPGASPAGRRTRSEPGGWLSRPGYQLILLVSLGIGAAVSVEAFRRGESFGAVVPGLGTAGVLFFVLAYLYRRCQLFVLSVQGRLPAKHEKKRST